MAYNLCSPGCSSSMINDLVCDQSCLVLECRYDGNDCNSCNEGCTLNLLLNYACDAACNASRCFYDNYSCLCAPGCYDFYLGNGVCNPECDFAVCNYDSEDCNPGKTDYISTLTIVGFIVIAISFCLILIVMIYYYRRRRNDFFLRVHTSEQTNRNYMIEINQKIPEFKCPEECIGETCAVCMEE